MDAVAGSAFAGDEGAGSGAQNGQEAAKSEMERVKVFADTMLNVYERDDTKADAPAGKTAHHRSHGKMDRGDEALKLDEVDLAVSTGLVPVKFAKQQNVDASRLLEQGDYFEANLVLKAIDDAIPIQTIAADDVEHNDASWPAIGYRL